LQTHGGEIRWRNIFVRTSGADEAKQALALAEAEAKAALSRALTLHASFDQGWSRLARGDQNVLRGARKDLVKAAPDRRRAAGARVGRFGAPCIS